MVRMTTVVAVCTALAWALSFQTASAQPKPEDGIRPELMPSPAGVLSKDAVGGKRLFNPNAKSLKQKGGELSTPLNNKPDLSAGAKLGPDAKAAVDRAAVAPGELKTPVVPQVGGDGAPLAKKEDAPDGFKIDAPSDSIERNPTGVSNIPCQPMELDEMVSLDFKDVPIDDLIRLMSCWTGKNFLLTQEFTGKNVTLMSPRQVTVAQAYRAFLSSLRAHNLAIVPAGAFLKIVPTDQTKGEPIPIKSKDSSVSNDDELMTKIVELKNISASDVTQVLDNFKGKNGELVAFGEETLIITDNAVMIKRMLKLLEEIDIPTDKEKIWVRPIIHADANEVSEMISNLFEKDSAAAKTVTPNARNSRANRTRGKGRNTKEAAAETGAKIIGGGTEAIGVSKVIADERTNLLIIVCNRTTYLRIDRLVRIIDRPIPGEGQIHIVYLENADSEEISQTLQGLTQNAGAARAKGGKGAAAGGESASLFEGEVKINADKGTNALVIEASLKDYLALKKVIDKLDIRRKQVYVEAIIMEISSNKDRKFGISGSAGTTFEMEGETIPLVMGLGGLGMAGIDMSQLNKGGLAMGLQGPLVDISTGSSSSDGDLSIPSFGFLIQAIASNSDVNILSTPHILTMDNEEAEIQVGKQIPYRASTMGGLSGLSSLAGLSGLGGASSALSGLGGYSSLMGGMGMGMVQRIDVDLTLKITPHVNESNFVKLEIDMSIEDVESIDRELGPTTSKRKVTNTVTVGDQQSVVIGGLIRDTESEGIDKVPLLGDIPLVGLLFRKNVRTTEKKNLLMIIVPHIIEDPSDLSRIHRERMEEIRKFAEYLATNQKEKEGMVDYRKKVGGLESMRQVVEKAKDDREAQEQARFEGTERDVVGPAESHDLDYDPNAEQPQQ